MAKLPDWRPNLVPEGEYRFKVTEEPEVRKTNNNLWLIVRMRITDTQGNERKYSDLFFPSDDKYQALLLVAGAKPDKKGVPHLSDMNTSELVGVEFEGEIHHETDRRDESKIRDTIKHIVVPGEPVQEEGEKEEDIPLPPEEEDDKIPF